MMTIPPGSDVLLRLSGSAGAVGIGQQGVVEACGDMVISGSFFPGLDNASDLGSDTHRWANVYTADLHLRNDKGDWTIQEEADRLIVVNNLTGKRFKMALEPLGEDE